MSYLHPSSTKRLSRDKTTVSASEEKTSSIAKCLRFELPEPWVRRVLIPEEISCVFSWPEVGSFPRALRDSAGVDELSPCGSMSKFPDRREAPLLGRRRFFGGMGICFCD